MPKGNRPERRQATDRRAVVERAALLAVEAVELSDICDAQSRTLTAIQRQIELLRTATAPDVQRQVALGNVRDLHQELERLSERVRQSLSRIGGLLTVTPPASPAE